MGFAQGFAAGSRAAQDGIRIYNEREMKDGIKEISDAKSVEDIQPVDPNYEGVDGPGMVSKGAKFMGKTYENGISDAEMNAVKNQAIAGVVKKYDPIRGIQLENDARRSAREETAYQREEAHMKERKDTFDQTSFATGQKQYAEGMKTYEEQKKQFDADTAAGKTGLMAPAAPTKPQFSIGDTMLDNAKLFAVDAKHGKVDPDKFMAYSNSMRKLGEEGYAQTLKLAQGGSPLADVLANYNKNGQDKIDPSQVVSDKMVKGKDGVSSRVIEFKDGNGQLHAINSMAELDKLGEADKIFTRHFQQQQANNSAATLGIAQKTFDRTVQQDNDKKVAGAALYAEQNTSATPAQIAAVKAGVIPAVPDPKAYKMNMSEVFNAFGTPAVGADGKPVSDPLTGRQVVNRNQDKEQAFLKWMDDNKITDTDRGLAIYMARGGAPATPGAAPGAPAAAQYKQGQEMAIKAGANAGKTAVFDGKGWVLKQ